ncbi:MAG TPA: PilC/PilY family type IV pilus protein, partial [Thermoanaerobaculia bacterium]|nr:PilC/PilY family type IV pilus protein [Thermoanaerobaculia bacterium]
RVRTYNSCSDASNSNPATDSGPQTVLFVPYYDQDTESILFSSGSGQLGFDFIAREGSGQTFPTVVSGNAATRNRWGTVGSMHTYGSVCPSSNAPVQWEPNETASTGLTDGDSTSVLEKTTIEDPLGRGTGGGECTGSPFARGDVLPWDWIQHPQDPGAPEAGFEFSSRDEALFRLAPNTAVAGQYATVTQANLDAGLYPNFDVGDKVPDFRVARYFEDVPSSGRIALKSAFQNHPPLIAGGFTPLAGVLQALQDWAGYWEPCAKDPETGDPTYECRQRFNILLTDGIQSSNCAGSPAQAAANLYDATTIDLGGGNVGPGIRTLVVGFGAFLTGGTTSSELVEIAAAGGTGTGDVDGNGVMDCEQFSVPGFDLCATDGVILAADKEELVEALGKVVGALVASPTSFATAAVPQSQTVSEDSIFLASFIPAENEPHYLGRLWHFVRPLPTTLNSDNVRVPDTSVLCNPADTDPESCLAWDANASMLGQNGAFDQVPTFEESESDLRLGMATGQRRIYYSLDPSAGGTVPTGADDVGRTMRLLMPTTNDAEREDLRLGFELPPGTTAAVDASVLAIVRGVVSERSIPDPDEDDGLLKYILGDIFHSDPTFLGQPTRTELLFAEPAPVSDPCAVASAKTYGCFFSKHRFRRQVVFAGANDGLLHAFDAGEFTSNQQDSLERGRYDLGTGQELFAMVPRTLLPSLRTLATSTTHDFRFDGAVRLEDVFIDPVHTGTPTANQREWRTVLLAGYREGGQGYVALDVTQPDPLQERTLGSGVTLRTYYTPTSSSYVPGCLTGTYVASACGPVPYATALWEISSDQAAFADLGYTWSRPTTARVRVRLADGTIERRYVAIFGGGFDPSNPNGRTGSSPSLGRHLYMVDIETGQILYQRELDGSSVPSDPGVADLDGDGAADTLYIGTYGGSMFKVDMKLPAALDSAGKVAAGQWEPFEVFCTGTWNDGTGLCNDSRPIFFPPSIIFVGTRGRFALAFGTGDRDDLWNPSRTNEAGRFYVILDTGWGEPLNTTVLPLVETDFTVIAADAVAQDVDRLTDPLHNGYVLGLGAAEKLFATSFALSGLLVFNTAIPLEATGVQDGATLCEFSANSNIYTLFTASGDALSGVLDAPRFRTVAGAVSRPFTETTTRNLGAGAGGDGSGGDGGEDPPSPLSPEHIDIMRELMKLFPPNCRFANVTVDINSVHQDTSVRLTAPVPVCVIQKNWREM